MPYWFRAKRYGWGWGLPTAWQGWVVLGAFIALLVTAFVVFPPRTSLGGFLTSVLTLNALMFAICWLKGEPPRWRWGK
jgi:hypothetical protein